MKKMFCITAFLLFIFILTGCREKRLQEAENSAQFNIVCCNFPEYDWVRNITEGSENVHVQLLVDDGTDIHSFQPSARDMVTVSDCDMFIYSGGETTDWMEEITKNSENENMIVINLMDAPGLTIKTEEKTEGMESEEHDHEHEESEYDEHVWLSLKNATVLCDYITDSMVKMDGENADLYEANSVSYIAKLKELDEAFVIAVDTASVKSVVFADRFPFRYLTDDYGLEYYAAFPGCSTETDASFKTVIFLAEKVDELNLKNLIVIDGSDREVAESVIANTSDKNTGIVEMNSMQSVSADDLEGGCTYLKYMEDNLEALVQAMSLNEE